jgi:hypothetical protein
MYKLLMMNQYKDFIVNKFDLLMELKIFDIVDLLENIKEKLPFLIN